MNNMEQLVQKVTLLLKTMDPATLQSLRSAVGQEHAKGGNTAAAVLSVLQSMDPKMRQQIEQQLGIRLDANNLEALNPFTGNKTANKNQRRR